MNEKQHTPEERADSAESALVAFAKLVGRMRLLQKQADHGIDEDEAKELEMIEEEVDVSVKWYGHTKPAKT